MTNARKPGVARAISVPVNADTRSRSSRFALNSFAFLIGAVITLVAVLAIASPAQANISATVNATYPDSTAAGAHSDYQQAITLTPSPTSDDLKNLQIDFPAGLVGNPNAVPNALRCTVDYTGLPPSPSYAGCPNSSDVGDITVTATSSVASCHTITLTGDIYVLRNRPSATPEVPTHLGIHVTGSAHTPLLLCIVPLTVNLDMTAQINLRDSDSGLRIKILDNITRTDPIIGGDIRVQTITQKVEGIADQGTVSAADDIPFLTNPTRCDAWTTTVYTRAWDSNSNVDVDIDPAIAGNDYKQATSTLASPNCASLGTHPFNPGFTLTTANTQAGAPTAMTAVLTNTVPVTPGTNLRQPSYVKRVDLPLPSGYKINPAIANKIGAAGCTDAQFNEADADVAPTCPAATQIGTVSISTPLITGAVAGTVYLGSPGPSGTGTDRYRLFVYATNGASVKLQGRATVALNGDVSVTFGDPSYDKSLPQFPFTNFTLNFDTGVAAQQMVVNPQVCGSYLSTATLTPWTNPTEAAVTRDNSLTVTAGSNGSCGFDAFNPVFTANVTDTGADKHPNLTLGVTRADRQDNIRDLTFSFPTGMSGSLTAAPTPCPAVTAAAGTCGASSQVGTIAVQVGSGAQTVTLNGTVHINQSADAGDVGRLSIQLPAVVGPFNLGTVVIYSRLHLRSNMGIDSINANMPQSVEGIPVTYRSLTLTLNGIHDQGTGPTTDDKPFLQNPSTCGVLNFDASITSNGDAPAVSPTTVSRSDTNQSTTGCPRSFTPAIDITPSTTETAKPTGLTVAVTVPQVTSGVTSSTIQQSTAKRVQLTMPVGMEINPAFTNGLTECSTANIDAGGDSCAASSQIGTISLVTPLLSGTQSGKVFLETQGGTPTTRYKLGLVIDLAGVNGQPFVLHGTAQVNGSGSGVGGGNGQITADIDNIPDLPFSSFSLIFNSGANAMFTNPETCASQSFSAAITPNTTGGSVANLTDAYTTSYNGSGSACPGSDPWAPTFSQAVSTTVAGAHPNVTLTVDRPDKDQDLSGFTIDLPDGLSGSAAAAPTCTQASADAGTCASTQPASRVGTILTKVGSGTATLDLTGTLYNTVAPGGTAARLTAIVPVVAGPFTLGTLSLPTDITLRSGSLGLHTTTLNLPQRYEGIPIRYRQVQVVMNGLADQGDGPGANDVPFMTNPSKCQLNTTNVSIDSTVPNSIARTGTYTTTGCPSAFNPSIDTTLSSTESGKPTGLTFALNVPSDQSTVKRVQLTMPTGFEVNPAFGNGLTACSTAAIDAGGGACAASSQIGTASLATPLLSGTQTGEIFLEAPGGTPTTRYKIAIVVHLPGQNLVLHGQAQVNGSGGGADAGNGQVTADFDNAPDVPFTNLTAAFDTGDNALLTNPETCGVKVFSADVTPNTTGGAVATRTANETISYDGAGAACPGSDPFSPTFGMTVSSTVAGAHPDVSMSFTRPDKHQKLKNIAIHFPQGFAASATAADTCSQAAAAAGTCTSDSLVGTIDTTVGSGGDTLALSGEIHNTVTSTGEAGRFTAIVHAVVGPYDLGYLNVPIIATLRGDYGIDATAQVPERFEGVPVRIRTLDIDLPGNGPDGPLFTNPSTCGSNTTNVDMTSPSSALATGSHSFTTTGCPIAFNPSFGVTADTLENGQPSGLQLVFGVPAGNSGVQRIQLTFPAGMEINPAVGNGLAACSTTDIDNGGSACAAGSVMGTVTLNTPLLASAQSGTVYLETPGGSAATRYKLAIVIHLPGRDLIVHGSAQISGNGSGADSGTGQVTADFNGIPDLPFSTLTVDLNTGSRALLTNPVQCGNYDVAAAITPHTTGGSVANRTVTGAISYDGAGAACPGSEPFSPTLGGSISSTVAGAHPNLTLTVTRGDKQKKLRKVAFHLPVGLAGSAAAAPTCAQALADIGGCAANTEVGSIVAAIGSGSESLTINTGKIYNTVAPANRPAKLTASIPVVVGPYDLGKVIVPIDVSLRGDYGIDAETGNLPLRWEGIPVRVRSLATTLNGTAANGPFLTNSSSCQSNAITADMTSEAADVVTGAYNYSTTGCPITFNPTISVTPDTTEYGQPNGLTLGVNVPADNSTVKTIAFTFPNGMEINPAVGNGIATCSAAAIDAGGATCPAGSVAGTLSLTTPLLASVQTGTLYLENPGSTSSDRYKLGAVIHLPGEDIVLHGVAVVNGDGGGSDAGTGQVTATFDNVPDLPFSNLTIALETGDQALLTNPASCASQTVSADLTPHTTGGAVATRTAAFTTSYDGAGASCPGSDPFSPTFDVSVTDTAASAHPDVTLTVARGDKQKKLRKVKFSLPVGFTGSAAAAPTCTQVVADAGNCAVNTKIGDIVTEVGSGGETYELTGAVYNTVAPVNKPAKMTAIIPVVVGPYDFGKLIVPIDISLRSGFGIDAETGNLPLRFHGIPVRIRSLATTLEGIAANGPFITNPSKCQVNTFDADMTSETANVVSASDGFTTTGCPAAFDPDITADTDTSEYGQPSGLTIGVDVPENNSTVKRLQLALPDGMELNPAVGNGLNTCSTATIDAGGGACPVASQMGTVTLTTPLLSDPQVGTLYLESPGGTPSTRYKLGIVIHIPDEDFIAHGSVQVDGNGSVPQDLGDGQITADFDNLPDISFSNFTVALRTGDRALVTNPTSCGNHLVSVDITPNTTGGGAVTRTASFDVDYNGAGGSCPLDEPFSPTVGVTLLANAQTPDPQQAGSHPDVRVTIGRPDKHEAVRRVKLRLPNGFTGSAAAAPTCTQVNADAGNCATNTQIGGVTLDVGSGDETFTVNGTLNNTVAPVDRPAKLTAIVPVVVGPYDLGKVIVPIDTNLDGNTFELTAETGNLPLRHEGIPVRVRQMLIDLDGFADQGTPSTADDEAFITIPHSCGSHNVYAEVTSPRPQTVTANNSITTTGCPFQFDPDPVITVNNLTKTAAQPTALDATIDMGGSNDATVESIVMTLPAGFRINAGGAQGASACSAASLDADTCLATSDVGDATLVTPLLNNPLTGDVYLETPGNTAADRYKLAVKLRGATEITIRGVAQVNETTGEIVAVFDDLPDLAFETFELNLTGRNNVPLLVNPASGCPGPLTTNAAFTPYGGGTVDTASDTTSITVTGCDPDPDFTPDFDVALSTSQAGTHPNATFTVDRADGDEDLRNVAVSLPPGFLGSAGAVPLCSISAAQAGTCAAASKVGTVQVAVGNGPDLLTVNGDVYMTEGQNGDIAGMAIELPAIAGPYDLGVVNVLGRAILRTSTDHGIDVVFNDIPRAFKGVPVPIRDMTLTINGMAGGNPVLYNASSCAADGFDSELTSYDANTDSETIPYQATDCASRAFQPALSVQATGGSTKVPPTWDIGLTIPSGHSTLKSIQTILPAVMTYNLAGVPLQNQCHQAQIDTQSCPAQSKYGEVTINTPLLPYAVGGDVYVADGLPSAPLPRIVIKVNAPVSLQLVGVNDLVRSQIVTSFSGIPDLVFTRMNLHFYGGANGLIKAHGKGSCNVEMGGATSHSGQSTGISASVTGLPGGTCGTEPPECKTPNSWVKTKGVKAANAGNNMSLSLNFSFASNECFVLKAFQVRFPKGSKVNKKKFKKSLSAITDGGRFKGTDFAPRGKDGLRLKSTKGKEIRSITINAKKAAVWMPAKFFCVGLKGKPKKKCRGKTLKFHFVFAKSSGEAINWDYYAPVTAAGFR